MLATWIELWRNLILSLATLGLNSVVIYKYKYKYKIKTYNAPYVTRVIRRRVDDTRLGSIGNAKKMTFESTFKNTNRNTISNIMWQSIPDSGGRVFIATRG